MVLLHNKNKLEQRDLIPMQVVNSVPTMCLDVVWGVNKGLIHVNVWGMPDGETQALLGDAVHTRLSHKQTKVLYYKTKIPITTDTMFSRFSAKSGWFFEALGRQPKIWPIILNKTSKNYKFPANLKLNDLKYIIVSRWIIV